MKAIITDTKKTKRLYDSTKTVNPWDIESDPSAWIGGQQAVNSTHLVPAVYSAWQMRSKAMADLPFTIYGKGDKAIDDSDSYKNKTGLFVNPRNFLWQAEASLVGYGRAYWLKQANEYAILKGLQYFNPTTITPYIDPKKGLTRFDRVVNSGNEKYTPDELLYIWIPDPSVELGAPTIYPLASALLCAGALDKINMFVKDFMERGAVKAMILSAKDMPDEEEAKRVETWFNRFMRGFSRDWKLINAEAITPTVIGDGLETFRGITITEELVTQINVAFGTRNMLEDDNYATAMVRQRDFYSNTIMPDARLISDALNIQVLNEKGFHIEFEPERLECFQDDETQKATGLSTLIKAFIAGGLPANYSLPLAMEMLGYNLSPDQQAKIKEGLAAGEKAKDEKRPVEVQPNDQNSAQPDQQLQNQTQKTMRSKEFTADLDKWQRKSVNAIEKGKSAAVEFDSDAIQRDEAKALYNALGSCKTADEVKALFGHVKTEPAPETIQVGKVDPAPAQPNTINIYATMPAVPASKPPDITVNVPAPIVNVAPPDVKIKNDIPVPVVNVAPADVVIRETKKPKKVKVTRDQNGRLMGLEAE